MLATPESHLLLVALREGYERGDEGIDLLLGIVKAESAEFFQHSCAGHECLAGEGDSLELQNAFIIVGKLAHSISEFQQTRGGTSTALGSLRPEGVNVVSLVPDPELRTQLMDTTIPIVWVDAKVDGQTSVYIDNAAGGRLAAEHLIGLGHTRIAFVGDEEAGDFGFTSSAERRRGFTEALQHHGLDAGIVRTGPHGQDVAQRLATELLTGREAPTAIVTASDTQAVGVLAAAAALGLDVPGDVSVVGFDDVELAELVGLTTVRQPIADSGREAARLLLASIDDPTVDRSQVQLPLELIERRSTGAASASAGASISNHK